MTGISTALQAGLAAATSFTKALFADSWTAQQVADFVNEQRSITIATTNQAGQPHAAVVIGGSVRDAIFFTVNDESVLARNLTANDRLGVSVCAGAHSVMGQGRGLAVGRAATVEDLIAELAAASPHGRFTPPGWDGIVYTIDLRRLFAN